MVLSLYGRRKFAVKKNTSQLLGPESSRPEQNISHLEQFVFKKKFFHKREE